MARSRQSPRTRVAHASSNVAREIIWLRNLLAELDPIGISTISEYEFPPISMAINNQEAIILVTLGSHNRRTRYINVRYHYIRECVKAGIIAPHYTPISNILADGLTKTLDRQKFSTFISLINIRSLTA
jgi:hypothetical protein